MGSSSYKEEQRFPLWIYLLTILPAFFILCLFLYFLLTQDYKESLPLLFVLLIMLGVNALIYFATLKTKIDSNGVYIKFAPLTNKKIPWHDIESAEVIKYGFVGYGWRLSLKYGRVYNTKGNKGLFIVKKNKQKILIGTQQPEKLKIVISAYI